jgi:hypothetical protein
MKYLKLEDAAMKYLKIDDAGATFLKLTDAQEQYLKVEGADARYLKLGDASQFLKIEDAAKKYLSLEDAARFIKLDDADKRYIKLGEAIAGHGAVFTGFADVGDSKTEPVLSVPGVAQVNAHSNGRNEGTQFILIALRPIQGQVQVSSEGGSPAVHDISLPTGGTFTVDAAGPTMATFQLLVHDDAGNVDVTTLTLSGSIVEGPSPHMLVAGQALVGSPS